MVSREFIRSVVRKRHAIAVHMRGEQKNEGFFKPIYVIIDLILDEDEEKDLMWNTINKVDTDGLIKVRAFCVSQFDSSSKDSKPQEFIINTKDIEEYETINGI